MSLNPIDRNRLREHIRKRLKELKRQLASADSDSGKSQSERNQQDSSTGLVLDLKLPIS